MSGNRALEGLRILLVEDAPDIRDAFSVLLRAEGAEVAVTGSGREAVEEVPRGPIDVLLTDLGLPDIPGDILIRQVLATARGRPRVIVVTGYGEPYASRAREAGADVILTKPVEWAALLQELRAVRARARAPAPPAPVLPSAVAA